MSPYAPWATTLGIWVAAGITLAVYSFLYKDNPFYKLAEHLYIGVSTGYLIVIAWNDAILPQFVVKLFFQSPPAYVVLIPGIMGLMMYTRFIKGVSWVSRISLAFVIGWGAGVAAPVVVQGSLIRHMGSTLTPLFKMDYFSLDGWSVFFGILALAFWGSLLYLVQSDKYADWERGRRAILITGIVLFTTLFFVSSIIFSQLGVGDVFGYLFSGDKTNVEILEKSLAAFMRTFYALVILVGVITVLFYFFYSIEHKKILKGVAKTGIIFQMLFFGAAFGYTVMGRVSLAIGRLRFLVEEWVQPSKASHWFIGLGAFVIIALILLLPERLKSSRE
ncbi:hypothetical protein JW926_16800 [Candidatus Sumerlaeota bacterium]|nr:hypothetical protein [Candidatus Sumerlaeota bacterium]